MNVPTYRGLQSDLEAKKLEARDWMIAQCKRIVTTFRPEVADEINAMLDELVANGTSSNHKHFSAHGFRQSIDRQSTGWSYRASNEHRADWFYKWEIGQNQRCSYGAQKIVLRKNGTIHEDNLKGALWDWGCRAVRLKREDDIYGKNKEQYEQLQSPGKHDTFFTVDLSKTVIGKATVKYSDATVKLGPIRDVPIDCIGRTVNEMKDIAGTFDKDMKEITGKRQ